MRFIQGPVKDYFLEYQDLRVALALILASGILFLVLSLVGTCGANMKNEGTGFYLKKQACKIEFPEN